MQNKNTHRVIGAWTMMFSSVSAIIGSGWLFSAYYSSQIAGPGAIISWVLAALLVIIVAFTFAEISTLLPVSGGSSHFPHITHGALVSVVLSWISWLSMGVLPTVEVQAVLQYASFFFPWLLTDSNSVDTALSIPGYAVAVSLLVLFSIINVYSLRWVMRFNNMITIWKIIIPILAAITLIVSSFHSSNLTQYGGFLPEGWHGVFGAISAGGIVFAFNGFKNVIEMAGDAANPRRTVPFALIGSLLVCLVVYLLLQIAFLGAVSPADLANGWVNLRFAGSASPLVTLLMLGGSVFMLGVLYTGAMVAPLGAGLMYATSSSRVLQAMAHNRQIPNAVAMYNQKGVPVVAIGVNLGLALLFFFPFPGWKQMVDFITSLMMFSYSLGPICLLVLRYQLPNEKRAIKLPYGKLWSFLAFYICTLMCYWTGWHVISRLGSFLLFVISFYFIYRACSPTARKIPLDIRASTWMWVYFIGLAFLSYLGNFGGGTERLTFGPDFIALALLSVLVLYLAVRYRASDEVVARKCHDLLEGTKSSNTDEPELEPVPII